MANQACLSIGIGDAPPLDYLRGAVNGARAIDAWARAEGYQTRLLIDTVDAIEFADVDKALTELLANGADRLLLYFAGHGLSTGAADDMWLLSRWSDVGQGVSVNQLRNRLHRYGVRQLVIMSDACRTPVDARTQDITGHPVLSRGPFSETLPQVDLWFAASPARAAWMIPGRTPAETRCVFSGLLAEALAGGHASAFDAGRITNFSLADFLEAEVPQVAGRYNVELRPAITTSIRPPANVYMGNPPPSPPDMPPWPAPGSDLATVMAGTGTTSIAPPPGESWSSPPPPPPPRRTGITQPASAAAAPVVRMSLETLASSDAQAMDRAEAETEATVQRTMQAFQLEQRPSHFETGAGFVVSGGEVLEALVGAAGVVVRLGDDGPWRVEPTSASFAGPWWENSIPLRLPLPLLIQMQGGDWIGAAAMPDFVLSFTLSERGAESAIYRWMQSPYARGTEEVMARLRASGLARERAPEVLAALRGHKHADPMLGVLAAYLHESMGDIDNVRRTAWYFAQRNQPIPFDIALLGRLEAHRTDVPGLVEVVIPEVPEDTGMRSGPGYLRAATPAGTGRVAGAFPFLRQGWGLLDPEGRGDLYPAGLAALAEHLRPAPFTTLDAAGGAELARLLFGED